VEVRNMAIDRKAVVVAAINHEQTSLCPYRFNWDGQAIAEEMDRAYGSSEWRDTFRNYIDVFVPIDTGEFRSGSALMRDVYGSLWRTDRRPMHLEEPALKTPSLRGYQLPDPDVLLPAGWEKHALEFIDANRDRFVAVGIGYGIFERSWSIRGFEDLLTDAVGEPAFFADLIGAVCEHQLKLLDRLIDLPFDGIMFGDDWGHQQGVIFGPQRWRDVIKPNMAKQFARSKAAGKYALHHSCGSVAEIIPDLIDIGLDVLESVQPEACGMNPYHLKDRFGDKLTFWGGLGSQSIIPFGTPDELREEIRKLAAHMGTNGGYILAPAKGLQPGTPPENGLAILEEFIKLGESTSDR